MAKVLLIEDDSLMVKMYDMKFTHDGFDVETALDGEEGVEKAKTTNPDTIILDIMLPKISGAQVLEKLKEDPKTKDIPVIVLTNLSITEEEVTKCRELGAKEVLMKTEITPQDVVDKIKEYSK